MDLDPETPRPIISIGDHSSFSGFCTITAVSRVTIGSGVLIARFVHISDHSHSHSHASAEAGWQFALCLVPLLPVVM